MSEMVEKIINSETWVGVSGRLSDLSQPIEEKFHVTSSRKPTTP